MKDVFDGAEDPRKDQRFGGKIGWVPFAYHLIPRRALARVALVFRGGEMAGREPEGWKAIPVEEQLNHALSHIYAYLEGRRGETHLANAACRVLAALALDEDEPVLLPDPPRGSGEGVPCSEKPVPGSLRTKGRVEPGGPVRGTGDGMRRKESKFVEEEGWKTSGERLWKRHGVPGRGIPPGPETLEKVLHYERNEEDDGRDGREGLGEVISDRPGHRQGNPKDDSPDSPKDQDVGPGEEGGS